MGFIPDLGVKRKDNKESASVSRSQSVQEKKKGTGGKGRNKQKKDSSTKKIASYSLEKSLIKELKNLSEEHNIFYSRFVSDAIKNWIKEHDY